MREIEIPEGAIYNGNEHLRRLVDHHEFVCEAGSLAECADYVDAKRCFDALIEHIREVNSENKEMKKALIFYRDNWTNSESLNEPRYSDFKEPTDALWDDCGQRAEKVLGN